jgi:CRP/FNR family transcriptional regulator, cyclic AMP receptor protein
MLAAYFYGLNYPLRFHSFNFLSVNQSFTPSANAVKIEQSTILRHLREFPLLRSLSETDFEQLSRVSELLEVGKYHFLYLADEPSAHVYLLVRGNVKTGIHILDGRELVKSIMHPTQIFGELGLSGEPKRAEFASSMNGDCTIVKIKTDDFRRVAATNYQLSQALMIEMGTRLRRAERQWESLILKDVRTRIVDFIKESAEIRGRQVGYETLFKHSLTQQDIASLVGASRQTVTAVLNDLRKSNLIYFNRHSILIRDLSKLN